MVVETPWRLGKQETCQPRSQALLPTPGAAAAPGVGKRAWVRGWKLAK